MLCLKWVLWFLLFFSFFSPEVGAEEDRSRSQRHCSDSTRQQKYVQGCLDRQELNLVETRATICLPSHAFSRVLQSVASQNQQQRAPRTRTESAAVAEAAATALLLSTGGKGTLTVPDTSLANTAAVSMHSPNLVMPGSGTNPVVGPFPFQPPSSCHFSSETWCGNGEVD